MGWISRIVIVGLALLALTSWSAQRAEAAVSVAVDPTETALIVQATGVDSNRNVTVTLLGLSQSVPLTPIQSEPNRTVYRSGQLAAGIYDVRVGSERILASVVEAVDLGGLQVLETEVARAQATLSILLTRFQQLNATVAATDQSQDQLAQRLSQLSAEFGNISAQLAQLRQSVELVRVPSGLATEKDVETSAEGTRASFARDVRRVQALAMASILGQVVLLGAAALLYVQRRNASPLEDVRASPIRSRGGIPQSDLLRRVLINRAPPQTADLAAAAIQTQPIVESVTAGASREPPPASPEQIAIVAPTPEPPVPESAPPPLSSTNGGAVAD